MIARSRLLVLAFGLVLVQSSEAKNRSVEEVLHAGYPFRVIIPVPEFQETETTELQGRKLPFITRMELKNGSIHLEGLCVEGDSNETLELSATSLGHTSNVSVYFSVKNLDTTSEDCKLYTAARIYMGLQDHDRDRSSVLARRKKILKNFHYPIEFVKVTRSTESWCSNYFCQYWYLHLMATDCPREHETFDVFSTVRRLVRLGKLGQHPLREGLLPLNVEVEPTEEFYKRFGDIEKPTLSEEVTSTTASPEQPRKTAFSENSLGDFSSEESSEESKEKSLSTEAHGEVSEDFSEESITTSTGEATASESTETPSSTESPDESARSSSPEKSSTTEVSGNNSSTTASPAFSTTGAPSPNASSGSSATMPLFTVTVLLATVSAVAVFTN